ncbi:16S rRNA (cytosine(967)-C(5))-methyltransferase RsmB [bacterium]|nr:16S rRNA (cytosine(967)-C(5))-methyltransferase RsmB [bacterium]MBU1651712.1 16S rRNA (cytosine(967)-C(5))-methyltransferase RsmB [bacterium]
MALIESWEDSEHTAEYLLDEVLSSSNLEPKSRARVTEEFLSWTRGRGSAKYLLNRKLKNGIGSLTPELRRKLEVAVTRLLFEERTPKPIIVSIAVDEIKSEFGPGLAKLANAVLRGLAEHGPEWPSKDNPINYLARSKSYPRWLVKRWLQRWSNTEVEALLDWHNQRPSTWLRWNLLRGELELAELKLTESGIVFESDDHFKGFYKLKSSFYPAAANLVFDGWFSVQDPSASLAVRLLNPQRGMKIADLCAAPGGKTTLLAQLSGDSAEIDAVDSSADRLQRLKVAIKQQGISCIKAHVSGAREFAERTQERYDAVLLDVFCSGLGVLGRRADLRWRRKPEDITDLAILQRELINAASIILKAGGALIYSTCTLEPDENERIVEDFLGNHPDFIIDKPVAEEFDDFRTPEGYLKTFSPQHHIDGVFSAKLIKQG